MKKKIKNFETDCAGLGKNYPYLPEVSIFHNGDWSNSVHGRRFPKGTDGPFAVQICQGWMVDHKKKNPYWQSGSTMALTSLLSSHNSQDSFSCQVNLVSLIRVSDPMLNLIPKSIHLFDYLNFSALFDVFL